MRPRNAVRRVFRPRIRHPARLSSARPATAATAAARPRPTWIRPHQHLQSQKPHTRRRPDWPDPTYHPRLAVIRSFHRYIPPLWGGMCESPSAVVTFTRIVTLLAYATALRKKAPGGRAGPASGGMHRRCHEPAESIVRQDRDKPGPVIRVTVGAGESRMLGSSSRYAGGRGCGFTTRCGCPAPAGPPERSRCR